ncbi:hypothetical protein ACLQ3K_22085 [Tsukamurella sp. DT100]
MLNVLLLLAAIYCAGVIGWSAVGTNTDRPTGTGLDVLERRGRDDA